MKIIPKNIAHKYLLPVPIFTSIYVAEAFSKDGEDFSVYLGLEKKYVDQLRMRSLDMYDTDLQKNTGDRKRFGEGSYEGWYMKNRVPFILVHTRTDTLAALIWLGQKQVGKKSIKFGAATDAEPQVLDNWHTISFRSYSPFRGKGLLKEFSGFALDVYKRNFDNINFWFGADSENKGMIALGEALGFEISNEHSDFANRWTVMVRKQK